MLAMDSCGAAFTSGTLVASFSNGDDPVALSYRSATGLWTASWLPLHSSASTVSIVMNAQSGSLTGSGKVPVTLASDPIGPVVFPTGIVNTADYSAPLSAAPGSVISIFGLNLASGTFTASTLPGPQTALGTTVWLGSRQLDLLYVSPVQINAFVPYDLTPDSSPQILVKRNGSASVPAKMFVSRRSPALFLTSADQTRPGLVIAYRGTQSFVVGPSAPVAVGDTLTLYCVGLGAVDQNLGADTIAPTSPLAHTTSPVTVTIGGATASVSFNGLTPGYNGLYQVNALVPAGAVKGNAVPVVVTIDGQSSTPVTIPIH
jgi:adhesin/invasin